MMVETLPSLNDMETRTIEFFDKRAEDYFNQSKNYDLRRNYQDFISLIPQDRRSSILDLGCGSGRDLKYFQEHGFNASGIDGSRALCDIAKEYSHCPVFNQSFLSLELPKERFHGIFSICSLFHIPKSELPRVLGQLHYSLKEEGVFLTTNPVGNLEDWNGESYGNYMGVDEYKQYIKDAGFQVIKYYEMTFGEPGRETTWLTIVSAK